jgi:hypothetical protein
MCERLPPILRSTKHPIILRCFIDANSVEAPIWSRVEREERDFLDGIGNETEEVERAARSATAR